MGMMGRAYLIQHRARREGRDAGRDSLDDGAEGIEENADDNELDATKHIGNLGCCRL